MNESRIVRRVLDAAEPCLAGKTVTDLVIGISLISCQLSDGSVGISYVLRHGLPPACSAFAYAKEALGRPAAEVAAWLLEKDDNVGRSVGSAVLSAASQQLPIPDDDDPDKMFGLEFTAEDTVGMIGLIGPVAQALKKRVKELIIFDEGVSVFGGNVTVQPMNRQAELLPGCNKLIVTGSSTINGTVDSLLEMGRNAEAVAMVGSSTPMYPAAWEGTNVKSLSGSWWRNEAKEDIFRTISRGGGIMELAPYMLKKAMPVD